MKNFYDPGVADELKRRIAALRPDSTRQWGKMNPAQAAAHLASALEMAVGDHMPPTMFLGRVFGRVGKWLLFRNDKPMVRNSPTVPELVTADPRDLERERKRLLSLVDRLAVGPSACTNVPHSFFGAMTTDEWAILLYKHIDHHLRQFGV